jgi:hypothetical protein
MTGKIDDLKSSQVSSEVCRVYQLYLTPARKQIARFSYSRCGILNCIRILLAENPSLQENFDYPRISVAKDGEAFWTKSPSDRC